MYADMYTYIRVHVCSSGALTENNRLGRALGVIKAYTTIMSAYRGEVPCTVTSAKVHVRVHLCVHHYVHVHVRVHTVCTFTQHTMQVSFLTCICDRPRGKVP